MIYADRECISHMRWEPILLLSGGLYVGLYGRLSYFSPDRHGGGGPGVGPIGLAEQLAPFAPGHPLVRRRPRAALVILHGR
jgi:hypothetical protein